MQRLRTTINQLGWLNGCCYLVARLLTAISKGRLHLHKYYFVAQPVLQKRWLAPKRGATLDIRQVTRFDPIVKVFPRPEKVIPYRFEQNAVCLTASKASEFVGFLWFTLGPYQEDEVRCRYIPLPNGKSAWDFDVYLHPEHRNGIAFLKLWDEANAFLTTRDIHWSLSRISAFNSHSRQSHGRMGAHHIGSVIFLTIGSHQISLATVEPYFHYSLHSDSFPTFALSPRHLGVNQSAT